MKNIVGLKKIITLLILGAAYMALCGFTYIPERPMDYSAEINFGVSAVGSNVEQIGANYYGKKITLSDTAETTKTGVAGAWSGNRNLGIRVNPDVFDGVYSVKATVTWLDLDHGQDVNNVYFRMDYFNLTGEIARTNDVKSEKTGLWVTSEIIINDIDLSNTGTLNSYFPTANILIVASGTRIDMGTTEEDDDYTGVIISDFKLEPLVNAYKLTQLTESEIASWKAGDSDLVTNMQLHTELTPLKEITDTNDITASGKSYLNSGTSEFKFTIPSDKFENARTVNVFIKYFDDISTNTGYIELRWPTPTLGIKWENSYAQASDRKWQQKTGLWQTMTFTLTNCDFTKIAGGYPDHNFQILTSGRVGDWGTQDDTSDDIIGLIISEVTITTVPEYSFSGITFTELKEDQKQIVTSLTPNEQINTHVTITRTGGTQETNVTLITALCDLETSRPERIAVQTQTMATDESKVFTTSFINPEVVAGKYVNIMIWDDLSGFKPISNQLHAINSSE